MREFLLKSLRKVARSAINFGIVSSVTMPFLKLFDLLGVDVVQWKAFFIVIFFFYNVGCELRGRCVGMWATGDEGYIGNPGATRRLCFACLYTVSFGVMLFWIWFPGDLLLINGAFQLMCLYVRGNTIHASLAGVKTA